MRSPTLILVGGVIFALLAIGVLVGLSVLAKADRRNARIMAVASPHVKSYLLPPPSASFSQIFHRFAPLARIAAVFGIDVELKHRYPAKWWLVLLITLGLGRAAAGLMAILIGEAMVMMTIPLWVFFARFVFGRFHTEHRTKLFKQLPDALGLIIRATRIGIPATEAMRTVAKEAPQPTADEFRRIAERLTIGQPFDRALAETAMKNGVSEYRFFATAMSLQAQTGGGLSETLENLSDVVRKRVALKARGLALASEARTSAAILAGLPFAAGGLIALLNPAYAAVLLYDASGQKILVLAIGMLLLGIGTMQAIIRKSLS